MSVRSILEGAMFIRKAFTVFLELWSTADRPSDGRSDRPSDRPPDRPPDRIVDWRWFEEEADAAAEIIHAAARYRDLCVTASLQVNAPS